MTWPRGTSRAPHRRKRDPPFPYDQDLSGILPRLNRRTVWGRARLANHRVTASLLAAGMRLLEQHFGPCAELAGHQQEPASRPVVAALRGRCARHNPEPFDRHGDGAGLLRDRWTPYSNFIVDLINFAMWQENYRPEFRTQRAANTRRLVHGRDGREFVRAVHDIAHRHTTDGMDMPSVRLGLALMTVADADEEIARIASGIYADYLGSWKELYAAVLRERGLRLRQGLTLDDLANALSAANDGVTLRALGDPASGVVDDARRRSLTGTVTLAVIHAFLEPETNPAACPWNRRLRRVSMGGARTYAADPGNRRPRERVPHAR